MERDKMLEWQAIQEAYLHMFTEIKTHFEYYLEAIEEENESVVFSEEVWNYFMALMEDDVKDADTIGEVRHVYPAAKAYVLKTALELIRDRFKDLLEDHND